MKVIYFPESLCGRRKGFSDGGSDFSQMTQLSDNNYSHILIRLSNIELCYLYSINSPEWSQQISNGETVWYAGMLIVPAPMAGSVSYHLEAQRTLLQSCFACSTLVKTEH